MQYPNVKYLYKYRPYNENTLAMLINNRIWVPKPEIFNDPFDCNIKISEVLSLEKMIELFKPVVKPGVTEEMIRQFLSDPESGEVNKVFKDLILDSRENKHNNIKNHGVLSLSEINDSILMWSHYSDHHRGLLLPLN